jgi:hypothetical protein
MDFTTIDGVSGQQWNLSWQNGDLPGKQTVGLWRFNHGYSPGISMRITMRVFGFNRKVEQVLARKRSV